MREYKKTLKLYAELEFKYNKSVFIDGNKGINNSDKKTQKEGTKKISEKDKLMKQKKELT